MQYRRAFVPGGSFFFTVVTDGRRPLLASQEAVEVLRNAFRVVRDKHHFDVDAIVVLPDHLHCIWTLPRDETDFAIRWQLIKTWFTKHCAPGLRPLANHAGVAKRGPAIWQQRYWEHLLRDEPDFTRHAEYIHYNPVKHGYATSPIEWPYSSFRRYVEAGTYSSDWGRGMIEFEDVGRE